MPTYGQRPQDVVTDSRGNTLQGITLKLYATEALALAGGTPLETVVTDSSGLWTYTAPAPTELWARLLSGRVWQVAENPSAVSAVASTDITDSTVTGRAVLTAASGAAARTAIGAGTSSLAIGPTGSDAKAGNYQPASTDITDATVTGRALLVAANAAAARTAAGAAATSHAHAGEDITSGMVASAYLPWAAPTIKGVVNLATSAETVTGTDTAKATTPAGVKAVADTKAALSHTHVATTDLTATGTKDATTFLRGDNTWAVPAGGGGGATVEARRMWSWGMTNTGGAGYGWAWAGGLSGASTQGTASGTDTLTLTSAATAGSKAGVVAGGEGHVTASWLPRFEFRGKFSSITNVRTWVAVGIQAAGDSDSAGFESAFSAARGAGIRHSTVAGDTTYKYVVTSSTGNTIVDSGVTANTSEHVFSVEFLSATQARFSIDGAAVQTVTASSGVLTDQIRWNAAAVSITQTTTAVSVVPRGAGYSFVTGGA